MLFIPYDYLCNYIGTYAVVYVRLVAVRVSLMTPHTAQSAPRCQESDENGCCLPPEHPRAGRIGREVACPARVAPETKS